MNTFLEAALNIYEQIKEIRRDLHQHPELGMEEVRTAGLVADFLDELGLDVKTRIGRTGVVGTLYTGRSGKTAAIRADMDALPVQDKKDVPYASTRPGVAHVCGHDGHTAMLLGAAKLLTHSSEALKGNVKFIFQPSEDKAPGGALPMIKEGALESPKVDGIFALHLNSNFPEGTVTVKPGYCTTSSAGFTLKMIGKGGHISTPHRSVDPIMMAGMCIVSSQAIVSQKTDPLESTVVGFGSVHGGNENNIIPDEVTLTGTLRTIRPEDRKKLASQLEEVAKGVAQISGGEYELDVKMEYPAVYNDEGMAMGLKGSAEKVVDSSRIIEQEQAIMGGEDVSYFFQKVPGVLWFLGTSNPDKGLIHPHHNPLFDFDEDVMPLGAAIHAQSVMDFLSGK